MYKYKTSVALSNFYTYTGVKLGTMSAPKKTHAPRFMHVHIRYNLYVLHFLTLNPCAAYKTLSFRVVTDHVIWEYIFFKGQFQATHQCPFLVTIQLKYLYVGFPSRVVNHTFVRWVWRANCSFTTMIHYQLYKYHKLMNEKHSASEHFRQRFFL